MICRVFHNSFVCNNPWRCDLCATPLKSALVNALHKEEKKRNLLLRYGGVL
jgi:hypothetical protein